MKKWIIIASVAASAALFSSALLKAEDSPTGPTTKPVEAPMVASAAPVLNYTMKSLTGKDVNLASYQGKVILMVNTASKCGNTPQYAPLEALYTKYSPKGFVILGFPSNDFGQQEPGTSEEISEFCTKNYGVTFDMFSKIDVNGSTAAPLYQFLTSPETNPKFAGKITWNFEKFLISKEGKVVNRFTPKTQPDSTQVVSAIEAELAK